jgi:hypothetical protein
MYVRAILTLGGTCACGIGCCGSTFQCACAFRQGYALKYVCTYIHQQDLSSSSKGTQKRQAPAFEDDDDDDDDDEDSEEEKKSAKKKRPASKAAPAAAAQVCVFTYSFLFMYACIFYQRSAVECKGNVPVSPAAYLQHTCSTFIRVRVGVGICWCRETCSF